MTVIEYIESGILDEYCLGLLSAEDKSNVLKWFNDYPEVREEVFKIQKTLYDYSLLDSMISPVEFQEKIWEALENLNKENNLDFNNLAIINQYTDYKKWMNLVIPLIPKEIPAEGFYHPLRVSEKIVQMLVVSGKDVENEIHDDLKESFIVLEGRCECTVGDKIIQLEQGGFIEMPLHTPHEVRALTPIVIAIMQRIAV